MTTQNSTYQIKQFAEQDGRTDAQMDAACCDCFNQSLAHIEKLNQYHRYKYIYILYILYT